jgi:hypothetical protein
MGAYLLDVYREIIKNSSYRTSAFVSQSWKNRQTVFV